MRTTYTKYKYLESNESSEGEYNVQNAAEI